jgi:enoyl-CoA hydratase
MDFKTILYEKIDKVAKITMNRPQVRNAESYLMSHELLEAFKMAESDDDIRVVILAGAGKDFSAGHDLGTKEAVAAGDKEPPELNIEECLKMETERWLENPMYVRDLDKPTIAMVQGHVIIGGLILMSMCDLIIASEDATFQDMSVRFGAPAAEFYFHPWDLGIRKTKEFLFTGDPIDAQEAYRLGWLNRVVPRENLEEETMRLANRIALGHPFTLKTIKMAANMTQDIQGYKLSMIPQFWLHNLTHAHFRADPNYVPWITRKFGENRPTVKDAIAFRDKPYEQKDK